MSEAKKLNPKSTLLNTNSDKTTIERVKETHTSELVIGICSQVGAKKDLIIESLKRELKGFDYTFQYLKLSDDINNFSDIIEVTETPEKTNGYNNYVKKIKIGNELRRIYGNEFLVNLAISKIADTKKNIFNVKGEEDFSNISSQRICYIIDSIKHKDELKTLREIYDGVFYLVSVFTPRIERIKNISIPNITENEAKDIIEIDEFQEFKKNGQQVREVFVDADFFIKVDSSNEISIDSKIKRFIDLIFENDVITPSFQERAMFEAKSASVNSACLSRQVGASIISDEGELLSIGWNDVPKYGGNLYSNESEIDNRCFNKGHCFNDKNKENIRSVITQSFEKKLDEKSIDNKTEIIKNTRWSSFKFIYSSFNRIFESSTC